MKKILLCLIAMFAIIAVTYQPASSITTPIVVNTGPTAFTNDLGTMIFKNFDGVAVGDTLVIIKPTANALPNVAITVPTPTQTEPLFLWVKLSPNNFTLFYDHLTGNMTVTLSNSHGSKSVTYNNWLNHFPGLIGPAEINAFNLRMKTAADYSGYSMTLRDMQLNGSEYVAATFTVPDATIIDQVWNITGITSGQDFTLTGVLDLPGDAYYNYTPDFLIQFDFGYINPVPPGPFGVGLMLWFDPMRIDNTNQLPEPLPPLPPLPANDAKIPLWVNNGDPLACVSADVPAPLPWKEPVFKLADFPTPWPGLTTTGWPGVNFTQSTRYGESSVMAFPPSSLVTSDWPTAPVLPFPPGTYLPQLGKNLFIAFSTSDLQNPIPQVIFEAGGGISGFNAYVQNGYLIMGIWNRLECAFFQMESPLSVGTHIAHLQFDYEPPTFDELGNLLFPGVSQVRMILDGIASPWATFHGLQFDNSPSAIGAEASGTMFYNRAGVFNDYARFFTGLIGDIKLYAGPMFAENIQVEYDYYAARYGTAPFYPDLQMPAKTSAWIVNSEKRTDLDASGKIADVYPNPFNNTATLSVNVAESQRVRVDLFDMTGVNVLSVYDGMAVKGLNSFSLNGNGLPTGVYAVRISGDTFTTTEKVVLSK